MSARFAMPAWFISIGLLCLALWLFGVSIRVTAGIFVVVAALRLAGIAAAASRRNPQ